ncbi:MAG: DUF1737 domain-containing protein [Thermodesulfobacteriota bacterium]
MDIKFISEYAIVSAKNIFDLVNVVQEHIGDGWQPLGSPSYYINIQISESAPEQLNQNIFYQAMVR